MTALNVAEQAAPVAPRTPKIGETVMVRHRVKANKTGVVSLEPCKGEVMKIKTVFMDGDVMIGDDLWSVKKATDGKTDWWTHAEAQREHRA